MAVCGCRSTSTEPSDKGLTKGTRPLAREADTRECVGSAPDSNPLAIERRTTIQFRNVYAFECKVETQEHVYVSNGFNIVQCMMWLWGCYANARSMPEMAMGLGSTTSHRDEQRERSHFQTEAAVIACT